MYWLIDTIIQQWYIAVVESEPSFDDPETATMTVTEGQTAVLPCSINNKGDYMVSTLLKAQTNCIDLQPMENNCFEIVVL